MLVAVVGDVPGAEPDGAIAIRSRTAWDLTGHGLSDGEDTWWFPDGAWLAPDETAWIVGDAAAWSAHDMPASRWTSDLWLADAGDDVALLGPAGVLDAFAYGDGDHPGIEGAVSYTSEALVYRRAGPDTDHADDWRTPRTHRLGESDLDRPTWNVPSVTAYASPDSSHGVLTGLLGGATERLHLHVYELNSPTLIDGLVAAAQRGVDVQVLIEDRPVGLSSDEDRERRAGLGRIEEAGGEAWFAGSARYRHHHLKVLVADDAVAVQSENWVPTGVPEDPSWGNRGWGVVLHSVEAADWFAAWMADDRAAWDTEPFRDHGDAPPRFPARAGAYRHVAAQTFEGPFSVSPFVSPDHTADPDEDPILALIHGAGASVRAQQLDLRIEATNPLGWHAPDGLTAGLAAAAGRGVDVSVLAAAPFRSDDDGNRPVLEWLDARGVDARELDRPGLVAMHNKALVVDDRWVALGSMNGNHHSRSNNREAGVVLDAPPVAAYFAALHDADVTGAAGRDWSVPLDDLQAIPATPVPILIGVMAVVARARCSRSSPGSRSR